MRTHSQSTLASRIARTQFNMMTVSEQAKGIYYGTVLQTDVSIGLGSTSPIPTGMMTVSIPTLNPKEVYGPMAYPGAIAPPLGTQVSVGFNSDNNPTALAIYGAPVGASGTVGLVKLTSLGANGSLTFEHGIITAFIAPT